MSGPRKDTKGILDAQRLRSRVRFRRLAAAEALGEFVEQYWLIDWNLDEPHEQHVVPHPAVNLAWHDDLEPAVHGVGLGLSSVKLDGRGRVFGVKFRPGAFSAFTDRQVSELTGKVLPARQLFGPVPDSVTQVVRHSEDDRERLAVMDRYLLGLRPQADAASVQAIALVDKIYRDRSILRVDALAASAHLSTRALQRLFNDHVGVAPKWVIRRYRIHEAIEKADALTDWPRLALDLGYADQAHLVRDFTQTTGMSPTAYARLLAG